MEEQHKVFPLLLLLLFQVLHVASQTDRGDCKLLLSSIQLLSCFLCLEIDIFITFIVYILSYLNNKERKYCAFPAPVLLSIVVGRYLGWRSVSYDLRGTKVDDTFIPPRDREGDPINVLIGASSAKNKKNKY